MHFWESEPDRLERTVSMLEQMMPGHSSFEASELSSHPEPHLNQTIIVEVVYRNLTGYFHWGSLWYELGMAFGVQWHYALPAALVLEYLQPPPFRLLIISGF